MAGLHPPHHPHHVAPPGAAPGSKEAAEAEAAEAAERKKLGEEADQLAEVGGGEGLKQGGRSQWMLLCFVSALPSRTYVGMLHTYNANQGGRGEQRAKGPAPAIRMHASHARPHPCPARRLPRPCRWRPGRPPRRRR